MRPRPLPAHDQAERHQDPARGTRRPGKGPRRPHQPQSPPRSSGLHRLEDLSHHRPRHVMRGRRSSGRQLAGSHDIVGNPASNWEPTVACVPAAYPVESWSRFHCAVASLWWCTPKSLAGNHHLTARPTAVRRHQQAASQPHSPLRGLCTRWIKLRLTVLSLGRRRVGRRAPQARTNGHAGDWTCGHLLSTLGPFRSAPNRYPETGSEGESLTTPRESVASGPKP